MKIRYVCAALIALSVALGACAPYNNYYPPVTVSNPQPASNSMHYGPPSAPPASSGMHYGPPAAPAYPAVTVTNSESESDSMHYGN